MRARGGSILALTALLAVGCATAGTSGGTSGSRTAAERKISCDGFIDAGSDLAATVASLGEVVECVTRPGPEGPVEVYSVGGAALPPGGGDPFAMTVLIFRFFGVDQPLDAGRYGIGNNPDGENFRYLSAKVPAELPGILGEAMVVRYEMSDGDYVSTFVCARGDTINSPNSRSFVEICRSIGGPATDDAVLAAAREIAAAYFPAVNP